MARKRKAVSPQQRSAVTRARNAVEAAGLPRNAADRERLFVLVERLRASLEKTGASSGSVASTLSATTRARVAKHEKQTKDRRAVARARKAVEAAGVPTTPREVARL